MLDVLRLRVKYYFFITSYTGNITKMCKPSLVIGVSNIDRCHEYINRCRKYIICIQILKYIKKCVNLRLLS